MLPNEIIFQKQRKYKDFSDILELDYFTTSIQHYTEDSSHCNKARTKNKEIEIGKELKRKLPLITNNIFVYTDNAMESTMSFKTTYVS